ncbi:MAG: mechanosensitive ion channel family protein, partial [Chloroflexi bacterium]|nr:mechanosensitive ion channel family protein [Chloroflexota bacterium]
EDLTLRRTTLRDFSGNVHTVPNSAVVVASNLTRGYAVIHEELQVPSTDLLEPATDVVNSVGRALAEDPRWADLVLEPPHVERIDALGPSGITLRISGRVLAGNRWSFVGDLRGRLLVAFREHGLPLVPSASPPADGAALPPASSAEPLPPGSAALAGPEPPPQA